MYDCPIIVYNKRISLNSPVILLYNSIIRKFGNNTVKVWKERRFELFSNGILKYYPYISGETNPETIEKASFNIDFVLFRLGDEANIETSGSDDYSLEHGLAIDLYVYSSLEEFDDASINIPAPSKTVNHNDKVMNLVFDTMKGLKEFLEAVSKATIRNNVREFANCVCWPIMKNPEEHVEFERTSTITSPSTLGNRSSVKSSTPSNTSIDYNNNNTITNITNDSPLIKNVIDDDDDDAEFDFEGGINVINDTTSSTKLLISPTIDTINVKGTTSPIKSEETDAQRRRKSLLLQMAADAGYTAAQVAKVATDNTVDAVGTLTTNTINAVENVATTTKNAAGIVVNAVSSVVIDKTARVNDSLETIQAIGEGIFRKQGSNVKSWKVRKYVVTSDHILWYYDISGVLKGNMSIKNVRVGDGAPEAIASSGIPASQQVRAVSLNVKSLTDNRVLEVVLETEGECKSFLKYINNASIISNIEAYVIKAGWDIKLFHKSKSPYIKNESPLRSHTNTTLTNISNLNEINSNEIKKNNSNSNSNSNQINNNLNNIKIIKTHENIFTEKIIAFLNNLFIILQLLSIQVSSQDKAATISVIMWFFSVFYIWTRPSILRYFIFIFYTYGIYHIILTSNVIKNSDVKINNTLSELNSIHNNETITKLEKERNWNINKKNQ